MFRLVSNNKTDFRSNVLDGPVLRRSFSHVRSRGDRLRGAGSGGSSRSSHIRLPQDDEGIKKIQWARKIVE